MGRRSFAMAFVVFFIGCAESSSDVLEVMIDGLPECTYDPASGDNRLRGLLVLELARGDSVHRLTYSGAVNEAMGEPERRRARTLRPIEPGAWTLRVGSCRDADDTSCSDATWLVEQRVDVTEASMQRVALRDPIDAPCLH